MIHRILTERKYGGIKTIVGSTEIKELWGKIQKIVARYELERMKKMENIVDATIKAQTTQIAKTEAQKPADDDTFKETCRLPADVLPTGDDLDAHHVDTV